MSTAQPPLSDTSIPDPPAPELLKRVGLTAEEYERLVGILGRKPNLVEMGICGAMWSEHCSYKTSRRHLKKLPVEGEGVLQGPGENAGAIDLGNDYAVVFKIESHNHPSAVEPFQGAATGVGGIIRDIFAMGARPVALLDSLRFGNLQALEEIGSDVGATRASPENQTPTTSENGGPDERVSGDARVAPTTVQWLSEPKPYVTVVNWLTNLRRPVFDKANLARKAVEALRQVDVEGTRILSYCLMPDTLLLALVLQPEQAERGDDAVADVVAEIKARLQEIGKEALRPGEQLWETGYRAQRKFDQAELDEAIKRLEYTPVQRGTVKSASDYPYVSESWRTGSAFGVDTGGTDAGAVQATWTAPGVSADQAARNRFLLSGVVGGISHYGNCIGIPTVGGEVVFDPTYTNNCLVNAMCVGIIRKDRLLKGIAEGPGNTALMVGAKTGRDGVQGATFASVDLADDYAKLRPAVQVGDPFMEKLLLEATLEIMGLPGLVGVQDLGAAGLTCSSVEMAARAETGMQLDLDSVPQRASDLSAYEMMLSESQERMMVVVQKGSEQPFLDVFHKWGLTAVPCGEVLPQKSLIVLHHGGQVAKMPNQPLANDAPDYDRPTAEPEAHKQRRHLSDADVALGLGRAGQNAPSEMLKLLLAHPSIASKRAVFQQYDFLVRGDTVQGPGLTDAAVVRIPETGQGLALATDGPGRHTFIDPHLGGARAVLETARNVLAVGAKPLGITNCLNFGNPEKPDRMWQFVQAVEGMGEACRELGLPVTGGNVSLYNETGGESILPTPVIGMVGLLEDWKKYVPNRTKATALELFILGSGTGRLDGSALAFDLGRLRGGELHGHNYDEFRRCSKFLQSAAGEGGIAACHDISDGGLAVALFELCGAGCEVDIAPLLKSDYDEAEHNLLAALFGEGGQRWLVAVDPARKGWLRTAALHYGAPLLPLGKSGGDALQLKNGGEVVIESAVVELADIYETSLAQQLQAA